MFSAGETITVLRPSTTTDRYGNTVADWDTATRTDVELCALAPRTSPEDLSNGRQGVIIGMTLYAPADADLRPSDRVLARGETFEVDGHPETWRNPYTGVDFGIEAALRRVEG